MPRLVNDDEVILTAHARPDLAWSLKVAAVCLLLWLGPLLALLLILGSDDVFTRIAVFFSIVFAISLGMLVWYLRGLKQY